MRSINGIGECWIKHRIMLKTRHTFITLMLDSGEHIGWIARQVGHTSPKIIFERYYSYIKNYQSEDGQKFIERVYNPIMENGEKLPQIYPTTKKRELAQSLTPSNHGIK